ncbi:MAG: hypothetical protein ILA02_04850 [Clostridia bacterium]|nr:hypothetical protein [Clostridia bacterium]
MAREVLKIQQCPCCGYNYEETQFFMIKEQVGKAVHPKEENGHLLLDDWFLGYVRNQFRKTGEIPEDFIDKCEIVEENFVKEVFDRKVITQGDQEFKRIKFPGLVACPKCGVCLDEDICTTTEEKIIE